MMAQIGDRIILDGTHLGDPRRIGVITAVAHAGGAPPYEVRWLDDGRTTFIFPGPEAKIEHAAAHLPDSTEGTP
jgi:Domain of unknown function (DUF1918)